MNINSALGTADFLVNNASVHHIEYIFITDNTIHISVPLKSMIINHIELVIKFYGLYSYYNPFIQGMVTGLAVVI